jgi:hypothetical protein
VGVLGVERLLLGPDQAATSTVTTLRSSRRGRAGASAGGGGGAGSGAGARVTGGGVEVRGSSMDGSEVRMARSSRWSCGPGSMPSSSEKVRRAAENAASASARRPDRYRASMSCARGRSRNG